MNTFVEAINSFRKKPKIDCNWDRMLLEAEQHRLKTFLEARDEEYMRKEQLGRLSLIGNPLLRMNE